MATISYLQMALNQKISEGWQVCITDSGKISPEIRSSKLYKALQRTKELHPSCVVDYVVGGKLRYASQGRHFATIIKKLED